MSNIDNSLVYEKGIQLSDSERHMIQKKAMSLNKIMAKILKNRPGQGLTYQQMKVTLEGIYGEVNIDSVRRGLSQMTGSKDAPESMKDKYGRWPLVKLAEKRLNPETGIRISLYAWNQLYNQPPSHRELVEKQRKNGQMNFHADLFEGVE